MKVVVPKKTESKFQVGDIITVGGSPYLIMENLFNHKNEKTYSARGFDGSTASNGEHNSVENLIANLKDYGHEVGHYPKGEFELKLERK